MFKCLCMSASESASGMCQVLKDIFLYPTKEGIFILAGSLQRTLGNISESK